MTNDIRKLIRESILVELLSSYEVRKLSSTVSNFLRTKYGSGLEGIEQNEFNEIVTVAIQDLMRTRKIKEPEMIKDIIRAVNLELIKSGERPHPNKIAQKPIMQPQKQNPNPAKQSFLSRIFNR